MPHPPRFDLDRLVAGEAVDAVRSHVAACPRCAAYVAEMTAVQTAYVAKKPADAFLAQCKARPQVGDVRGTHSVFRPRLVPIAAAAAGVLALGFVFYLNATGPSGIEGNAPEAPAEALQWRGGAVAHRIFVKNENGVVDLQQRPVKPGEKLRYQVALPDENVGFAAVVAIEAGEVIPVLPSGESDVAHQIVGTVVLPGSVEIQADTTELELLLFVRKDPFTVSQLMEQIREFNAENRPISSMSGLVSKQEVTP